MTDTLKYDIAALRSAIAYGPKSPIRDYDLLRRVVARLEGMFASEAQGKPDAWLFECKRPGHAARWASIDDDDSETWPLDQWTSVSKRPLYLPAPTAPTAPGVVVGEDFPLSGASEEVRDCPSIWAASSDRAELDDADLQHLRNLVNNTSICPAESCAVARAIDRLAAVSATQGTEAMRRLIDMVLSDMDVCCSECGSNYEFLELSPETVEALREFATPTAQSKPQEGK